MSDSSTTQQSTPQKIRKKAGMATSKHAKMNMSHLDSNAQLMEAIQLGKTRVIRRLLDSKADPNFTNEAGETPLMLACGVQDRETRLAILQLLIKRGVDLNQQDTSGQTALMKLALSRDERAMSLLLENKCKLSIEDCAGSNALLHTASTGHEEILRTLIAEYKHRRLDIDHQNMRGLTPLLVACQGGHLSCARALVLEGGASTTIRDLENFMSPKEWLETAFSDSNSDQLSVMDLEFLSPVTHRKKKLRQQRLTKSSVKTLSDFMSLESTGSAPNVFTAVCKEKENSILPHISDPGVRRTPSDETCDSESSESEHCVERSMFDVPHQHASKSSTRKSVPIRPATKPELASSSSISKHKSGLYQSNYLTRRQQFLTRNPQSDFFRKGSLKPLSTNPQDRIRELMDEELNRTPWEHAVTENSKFHQTLPPIVKKEHKS